MSDGKGKGTVANCPICGKRFKRRFANQITCGKSCAASWRAKNRETEPKLKREPADKGNCLICGRSLNGFKGNSRKYCSQKCYREGDRARKKAKIANNPMRDCEWCKKAYHPTYRTQRFCSRRCARENNMAGQQNGHNQLKSREVLLMVVKEVPVFPHLRPTVGKIYLGKDCLGQTGHTLIIPEIGKYGLLLREDEAKIVQGE